MAILTLFLPSETSGHVERSTIESRPTVNAQPATAPCMRGLTHGMCYMYTYSSSSYASVGGATRHTVIVRVCLSVCLSAQVLKDGEESAGGNCNIDITRYELKLDGLRFLN